MQVLSLLSNKGLIRYLRPKKNRIQHRHHAQGQNGTENQSGTEYHRHHTFHLSWNLNAAGQATRRQKRFVADDRFSLLLELLRVDSQASLGNPRGMKAYELYKQLRKIVMSGD